MRQNRAESSDRDSRFRYRVCVIIERVQTATQRTEAAEDTTRELMRTRKHFHL